MAGIHFIPKGMHSVNVYLVVSDARKLLEFVKQAFGATEVLRMETPGGGIAHAEFKIGDCIVETANATDHWPAMPAALHVYVADSDATYKQALAAGAVSLAEPKDQFYGERSASVRDAVGNVWHIATKTEEVSAEEMHRRAAELFK